MSVRLNWMILLLLVSCIIVTGVCMPDLFHLTVIKLNPFENKMEIKKENASGITIEVKSNGEIHPGTSEVTIVEEAYPKNTSKCVREIEAEKIALNVLLNDREAKRVISELIKSYGSLIVEFYKRQGISQQNGEIIERVCTGELMIYPKDFFRRDTIVYTHVDFVNKKLYLVPTLCDEISGSFCIRHVNLDFRAPTEKEEEFVREVLREKGYEWNKTSIAVIQQYIKLPNGTLVPSTVIYQVVLESESSETHRGFALTFDNKAEDIWIKGIFIIS